MKRHLLLCMILLTVLQFSAVGQNRTISGRVTSAADGTPLPGVSVVVRGTTIGASTDANGRYELNVTGNPTLVFSFVGFLNREVAVGTSSTIDVALAEDTKTINEVVVVGYGTQEARDVVGSIASVKGNEIADIPVPSVESAIQGRVAGVQITSGSGKVGQGIKVRVRGSASITAGNQPLYVVDGIPITSESQGISNNEPTNPLADLNPNDIESIEILKDAASSAIYGSRASNGVVIITTKRGKAGKTVFDLGVSTGFSKPTNKVDFLNSSEYLELFNESVENSALAQLYINFEIVADRDEFKDLFVPEWRNPANSDWQDQVFRTAGYQQYDLTASGGNEKTRFYVGGSFTDQEGILKGNNFERASGRINIDHTASDKLQLGVNFNLARSVNDRVADDNAFSTPLQIVALPPVQPIIDPETGEYNTNTTYYNGLIEIRDAFRKTIVYRNLSTIFASYTILPGLSFRSELGIDILNQNENTFQGRETQDGSPGGAAESRAVTILNYTTNNFLSFSKQFGEIHSVDATGGMSFQKTEYEANYVSGIGFPSDAFNRIANAAEINLGSSEGSEYSLLSYFARVNYKLLDKYLLSVSGRVDGSSRFGANNQYGFFPAIGIGWILTEEPFLSDTDFLSFLKLKASYGYTGNDNIGDFASRGLFTSGSYAGNSGIIPASVENPDLKWETTAQFDVGVNFGFFKNRINGGVEYYLKKTEDLLLNVQVPATSGFATITRNVGELENKGVEVTLNTDNLVGAFSWTTNFNISFNRNKITNLNGQVITSGVVNRAIEGQPIGVFYTFKYAGVDPANGDALYYLRAGSDETTNDYGAAEQQVVGDPNPEFVGGLNNTFAFKGFDLGVLLQFSYGNDIYNNAGRFQSANMDYVDNQTRDQLNRWRQPGDITRVPQARFGDANGSNTSSRWVYDGSYLRGKTLTLGYTVPTTLSSRFHLTRFRIYASAQNFFTITDYPGWDPEVDTPGTQTTSQRQNVGLGVDFYTTPQAKTITFGVNIGF
ncbi:SusC/RagA family TonB-linked outer membrane protein [Rufibacter latericius]|uniref:TonB-dependent receptor n=1 Tax=Rufibacter latericius TaxID=2487040 RepID=A0A3M9N0V2_9BACT|nr:TonB-dependent receptor [Rufibacter latericius]RNI31025.1 TonB-dependent receptor [Rufibacter latericius]